MACSISAHLHLLLELSRLGLVLLKLLVPCCVELLELQHVRLLHAEPLRNLPTAQRLLSPAELMLPQLLQTILGDLRLYILSLGLAVLAMLLQDDPTNTCDCRLRISEMLAKKTTEIVLQRYHAATAACPDLEFEMRTRQKSIAAPCTSTKRRPGAERCAPARC